jgi:eukaryotic-like serine/threonine-protein kinase
MTPTISDRDTFLQHLRQSGLLSGQQLRDAAERFGNGASATELARALVRRSWLTRFQARMLLLGRTSGFFLGPYRILELVGKGGMGRVYRALHETMNRTVALKVLAPSLVKTSKARMLFRQEVQTAAQLNHPNIVHAYDANSIDGRHYLAMEFIAGTTLTRLVQSRGPLPIGISCEIIRQAALGLQHAYEHRLVHRDIKPANLMVSVVRGTNPEAPERQLHVKILDFGLAQLHRRRKGPAEDPEAGRHPITGTPDFMSPEQARNRDMVDIRSDLYSLGCTFYYLLTGHVPFPGGSMLDKLIRHHSELPAPPEKLRPRIAPAVAAIVLKLLAKDPADRFQTPQELADALALYAAVPAPYRPRAPQVRVDPPHIPTAVAVEPKTLTPGLDDTAPHACAATEVSAEQEALSSWVEICVEERRRQRRMLWGVVATALGLAATAVTAILVWLHLGT